MLPSMSFLHIIPTKEVAILIPTSNSIPSANKGSTPEFSRVKDLTIFAERLQPRRTPSSADKDEITLSEFTL
ncbi:hypothetical protein F2Q69_00035947 [Brassica cretica]|uniref:Uncharacterized protein n=1 Tax=Brassica cretica TaxID=69181 RepID=A0A8S9SDY6_BRACR|nr:hypothetical protein F2Q69_00035947 [Brassica cretica]